MTWWQATPEIWGWPHWEFPKSWAPTEYLGWEIRFGLLVSGCGEVQELELGKTAIVHLVAEDRTRIHRSRGQKRFWEAEMLLEQQQAQWGIQL